MAIILALGKQTRIYQVKNIRKKWQYSLVAQVDVSSNQLGDYGASMSIINEIVGITDYLNEKIYFVLVNGSGTMFKTVNIPYGSLDIDLAEAKSEDEFEQALSMLKEKYILDGYEANDYEVYLLNYSTFGGNVYITLSFISKKLVSNIIELCKNNSLDLIGIMPELKLLKTVIACDFEQYILAQNEKMVLVNDFGILTLNGKYPEHLAKQFLLAEGNKLFETNYSDVPIIRAENVDQYLLMKADPADGYYDAGFISSFEIAAVTAAACQKEIKKLALNGKDKLAETEREVMGNGIIRKIKRIFTRK